MPFPTYTPYDYSALAQAAGISVEQVNRLYQIYVVIAGADGLVDRREFRNLSQRIFGRYIYDQRALKQASDYIFYTFDRNRSGGLSFAEFVSAISALGRGLV